MPSRLSSLLVRDGLVGVKRMEKAFQRQVIYGGSLDTILLEMGLVPEERLTQYLALASGLPPAAREEGMVVAPAAAAVITRELAERYRAVPVAIAHDAIRILVCAPLELTELEDLADLLDRPLQPLITPEYRWNLVYAAVYDLDPPARFTTLARSLDVDPASTPVGRPPTIIIDERTPAQYAQATQLSPVPADAQTLKLSGTASGPHRAPAPEEIRGRRHTIIGVIPSRQLSDGVVAQPASEDDTPPSGAALRAARASGPIPVLPAELVAQAASGQAIGTAIEPAPGTAPDAAPQAAIDALTERVLEPLPEARTSGPVPQTLPRTSGPVPVVGATPRTSGPVPVVGATSPRTSGPVPGSGGVPRPTASQRAAQLRSQPIETVGRDSPLPIVRAREILASAEDRDTVFLTLLRAARSRARWAGLLTVQGGAAIGRVALAEPGIDTAAVQTVLIPLDSVSPFRTVVGNHQSHIGPLISGDPSIDSMVLRMGGTVPPSALILPIVLRDRVVALVVAHRVNSDLKLVDVTELLPMATATSDAISRLIVTHKASSQRMTAQSAIVEIEAEMIDTKRISRGDVLRTPPVASGPPSAAGFEQGVEMSMEAGEPRPIDEVLSEIERADEGVAVDALAEAVERAPEAQRALVRRFPGKLRVDRFAVSGRPLRAAQYGGLLELVIRLGAEASELLIDRMAAPQRDTRFYATVCAAELRPRNAVAALAERMFDQDFGVRASAVEALTGYPVAELGHALVRARRAVHSTDPDVVAAASGALVTLGDADAIPDLIGVIERSDRGGEHARRALTALTAQDFGASERKWRKWYEAARRRHRIEWLIEGLGHKEDAIREGAINSLRRLTGEYFGYHHDLPRKERDASAERWAAWWRDTGHRKFATSESERHRPTAELPGRRDPES